MTSLQMRQRTTFFHNPQDAFDPKELSISSDTFHSLKGPPILAVREDRLTLQNDEIPADLERRLRALASDVNIRWASLDAYDTVAPVTSRLPPGLHVFYDPGLSNSGREKEKAKLDDLCGILRDYFGAEDLDDCSSKAFIKQPVRQRHRSNHTYSHVHYYYSQLASALASLISRTQQLACGSSSSSGSDKGSTIIQSMQEQCNEHFERLRRARSLDLTYLGFSASSGPVPPALKLTATWPLETQALHVSQPSQSTQSQQQQQQWRTEVGILTTASPPTLRPLEQGVAGLLTVLGESSKPAGTMFAFRPRHREVPEVKIAAAAAGSASKGNTFTTSLVAPSGMHPTLRLEFGAGVSAPEFTVSSDDWSGNEDRNSGEEAEEADDGSGSGNSNGGGSTKHTSCKIYAYLTLPRHVFPDRYQLADPLFLASRNLSALSYSAKPVDLEAPAYVTTEWGTTLMVQLAPPASAFAPAPFPSALSSSATHRRLSEPWSAEIPLHLRYLAPAPGGYTNTSVPYPVVFWVCSTSSASVTASSPPGTTSADNDDDDAEAAMSRSPFDRTVLGYDGLFPRGTTFWHVRPALSRPSESGVRGVAGMMNGHQQQLVLPVPVADSSQTGMVATVTTVVIVLGFLWVVAKLGIGAASATAKRGNVRS